MAWRGVTWYGVMCSARRAQGFPRRSPHVVLVSLLQRLSWRPAHFLAGYFAAHPVQGNVLAFVLVYMAWKSTVKIRQALVRSRVGGCCFQEHQQ